MQAGVYRSTMPTIPYSAAWGLVLNLAGVETRRPGDVTTLIDPGAPPLRICVGAVSFGEVSTLFQQLHSYPVGASGAELRSRTHGAKFWIAPVRREILVGFDALVGVESPDSALLERVGKGLRGELDGPRYGVPFAGDNNLLFDSIDLLQEPTPTHWYTRQSPGEPPRRRSCRLTVGIDREDSSRTTNSLVAPVPSPQKKPPEGAWFWVPGEPS
jgi:CRISPR-associated protein Cas5t